LIERSRTDRLPRALRTRGQEQPQVEHGGEACRDQEQAEQADLADEAGADLVGPVDHRLLEQVEPGPAERHVPVAAAQAGLRDQQQMAEQALADRRVVLEREDDDRVHVLDVLAQLGQFRRRAAFTPGEQKIFLAVALAERAEGDVAEEAGRRERGRRLRQRRLANQCGFAGRNVDRLMPVHDGAPRERNGRAVRISWTFIG
jgi:hypothetical protein